ncbi:UbiA prenyltransferase family [Daedaleopsis nitida]|nr:UbiA prenyltransferase family [Daedaleopsis nitida]
MPKYIVSRLTASSVSLPRSLVKLERAIAFHAYTAVLFTRSDLKTIFFPVLAFACTVAPVHSIPRLLLGMIWIWIHQLMCNVSNQARSQLEDAINKPWRPLPARRVTEQQAITLRWVTVFICFGISALIGPDLILITVGLLLTTLLYDEMGLAGHFIGKNLCNIAGYTSIEIGATKLVGVSGELDYVSITAVCLSGALIFTTVQAQDFADVEGDSALGRITFPIYAPELSRAITLFAIPFWAWGLGIFWDIGPWCRGTYSVIGALLGWRYYTLRTPAADRQSYLLYNVSIFRFVLHTTWGILYIDEAV